MKEDVSKPATFAALAPLRHPTFRAIWLGAMASNFGMLIQTVGAAWLMTQLAASADMVALVQASNALPIAFLALISGAIADSYDRRKVMLFAQCFMLVVATVLAIAAWYEALTPWTLLGLTFLIGSGMALNNPSWQASVGDMVGRDDLPQAVTLNSMGFNLSRSVGPAIGGAIVAAAGAAAAFAINAASYLVLIFVLVRWKPSLPASTLPRESLGSAVMTGLRYLVMSPKIEIVMLRSAMFGISASAVMALMPLIARDILAGGPQLFGLLLGAFGLGAVAVALSNSALRARFAGETLIRTGFLGFAACAFIASFSRSAPLTMVAMTLGGACWVLTLSLFNTTVQLSTPRWVVGRLLSLYQMATFTGMALGSWIWGLVTESYGASNALLAASVLMVAGAAIGLVLPLPAPPRLKLDPLNRWKEPHLALDIKPQSGPIVIMVEYRIGNDDMPEFLKSMAERRRLRFRNGARHWTLMRDLEDPELWQETYHLPTWTEYQRYHQRTTEADAVIAEAIRAMHKGPGKPVIHRMIERSTDWSANQHVTPKDMLDIH
ncbi:MFS transporter [Rhizobium sp. EC-SD404]|uniref:MFS transporter n=1 Tax=Rhizobium sp. EC-SD404 TaxID=2038389 RepID=UPI001253401B|nr:MFS transporter [Rhizobium sp. EC-SD404]VVT17674.1 Predicted arabinose efflux permease, MFS family [Rhizobium sp. EC-SD404]